MLYQFEYQTAHINCEKYSDKRQRSLPEGVSDVMGYLGINKSRDFTVNGMRYSKNKNGWYESQADSEAKVTYEMMKANNTLCHVTILVKFV